MSDGCPIFVKLRQFQRGDGRRCLIALGDSPLREGATLTPLHAFEGLRVSLLQLSAGATLKLDDNDNDGDNVTELFVLRGYAEHRRTPW